MRTESTAAIGRTKTRVQRWNRAGLPSQASGGSGPVALLLCLIFLAVLLRSAWLGDDALITLRTVLNVTHGYGLIYTSPNASRPTRIRSGC